MNRSRQHILHTVLFATLAIALVGLAIADMLIGTVDIPVRDVVSSMWGSVSQEE